MTISPKRGTVNSYISYSVVGYPKNAPVTITWRTLSGYVITIGTVYTNGSGAVSGRFRVPAATGGPGQLITFKSGSKSRSVNFEIAPRIKVIENPVQRGQYVDVSLRGYAKNEPVRIRWKNGTSWVTLDKVITSNSGSANTIVRVPSFAPNGQNSVRGDGAVFRQQTNAVNVQGGPAAAVGTTTATVGQPAHGLPKELVFFALPIVSVALSARARVRRKTTR